MMEAKAKNAGPQPWGLGPEEPVILKDFEVLLTGASPPPPYRWSLLVITATIQLASRYPKDREENWKFLETLVDKL